MCVFHVFAARTAVLQRVCLLVRSFGRSVGPVAILWLVCDRHLKHTAFLQLLGECGEDPLQMLDQPDELMYWEKGCVLSAMTEVGARGWRV